METPRVLSRLAASAVILTVASIAQAQLYWRIDTGASFSTSADIQDNNFALDQAICGDPACTTPGKIKDVGTAGILSGGAGWRFNPNLRADGTISYRGGYKISDTLPDATTLRAEVSSWSIMANGYYDLALPWGKPYVGVGMGWATNKVDVISATNLVAPGIVIRVPGGAKTGFAWALMAGVGVPIDPALTLDVAVRYTDLGKLATEEGVLAVNGVFTGVTYSGATGDLKAWELTIGFRFP
jgi:opacity protein-like surface antigen